MTRVVKVEEGREQVKEIEKVSTFRKAFLKVWCFGERPESPKPTKTEIERRDFGLAVLYDGADAEVDIVTVHGLNGHRERTFTADGICWPRSLLPDKIPKIRVLSYGYDSRTHSDGPLSREHLHGHAEQLVEKLTRKRATTEVCEILYAYTFLKGFPESAGVEPTLLLEIQERASLTMVYMQSTNRPIIFIAHSLGGIVVKSALILSHSFNPNHLEDQKSISLSTYGILFMGTPHAGGEGVSWGRLALNLASMVKYTNPEFLDVLERNSQWLEQQQTQYLSISGNFDTKFFYETYPTLLPGGTTLMIVEKNSACVPGARDAAPIAISSTHSDMVKFKSAEDEGFIAVAETLEIMLKNSKAALRVERNWQEWETIKNIHEGQKISYAIPMKLPFSANENFTGREEELHQMHSTLQTTTSGSVIARKRLVVLHGLGGIGKTQLALRYAYVYEKSYTAVWWVNASTTATLSQDFLEIAQQLISHHAKIRVHNGQGPDYAWIATVLGVPRDAISDTGKLINPADPKPIVEVVKSYLAEKDNQKWLLIIDNYDDVDNVNINDFLPTTSWGSIIITSRATACLSIGTGLEVTKVQLEEGVEILRKRINTPKEKFTEQRDAAIRIVERFDALPLALDQAGAYICQSQITCSKYLEKLDSSFKKLASKRPQGPGWLYRNDTLFTAWDISFASLPPDSQGLLLVCAFLDNADIWEGLFGPEKLKALGIDSLDDAIESIFSLSLAKRKSEDSFWIHAMVHQWLRERVDDEKERARGASLAVSFTSDLLPAGEFTQVRDVMSDLRLMPHVEVCYKHVYERRYLDSAKGDTKLLKSVHSLGRVLLYHFQVEPAENLFQWVLDGQEARGKHHPDTLTTVHDIGTAYAVKGQYTDALKWFTQALEGREAAFGRDDLITLATVNSIALLFASHAKYNEALEWHQRALTAKMNSKDLGTQPQDHPSTLETVYGMASVLELQGKFDEALKRYQQTLAGQQKAFGDDHLITLRTMHSIAIMFDTQGMFKEALEWLRKALDIEEQSKTLGKDHPSTLATVHSMARVYANQDNFEEALKCYMRTFNGEEKALGKDHTSTLDTMHSIAGLYRSQRMYTNALDWYRKALDIEEQSKKLGKEHPSTLATIHTMAGLYAEQADYDTALKYYKRTLDGETKALGADHHSPLDTMHSIAGLYVSQRMYPNAIEWFSKALDIEERSKTLGKNHPDTLSTVHSIARVYTEKGKYNDALQYFKRTLAGQEIALGKDHGATLETIHSIGRLFYFQGMYTEALKWYRKALFMKENSKELGKDHPFTLSTVRNMAEMYANQGKYDKALELYNRTLAGTKEKLGRNHHRTFSILISIAELFTRQGKYDDALHQYRLVLAAQEETLSKDPLFKFGTLQNMAMAFAKQGNLEEAIKLTNQILAGEKKTLGQSHPKTLATMVCVASLFWIQGKYNDALDWYRRVLALQEATLCKDNLSTLDTTFFIARALSDQGKYEKPKDDNRKYDNALKLHKQVHAGRAKILEDQHPDMISSTIAVAGIFNSQGKYAAAQTWYELALSAGKSREKNDTVSIELIRGIASLLKNQKKYSDAIQWYRQALAGSEKVHSASNYYTLEIVHDMASVFDSQKKYTDALKLYERALAGREKVLGSNHPATEATRDCIRAIKQKPSV